MKLADGAVGVLEIGLRPRAPRPLGVTVLDPVAAEEQQAPVALAERLAERQATACVSVISSSISFRRRVFARSTSSLVGGSAASPSMVSSRICARLVQRLLLAQVARRPSMKPGSCNGRISTCWPKRPSCCPPAPCRAGRTGAVAQHRRPAPRSARAHRDARAAGNVVQRHDLLPVAHAAQLDRSARRPAPARPCRSASSLRCGRGIAPKVRATRPASWLRRTCPATVSTALSGW